MRVDGIIAVVLIFVTLVMLLLFEKGRVRFNVTVAPDTAGDEPQPDVSWLTAGDFTGQRVEGDYNDRPWGPPRYVHGYTAI